MSALPVACRGSAAGAAVWWQGGGWSVTAYGLEESDGHSAISAGRLGDLDAAGGLRWIRLMDEAGADLDGFLGAFVVALALHGYSVDPALIPASAKAYRKNLRRLAYEASLKPKGKQRKAA
jgi:hypothetical protein